MSGTREDITVIDDRLRLGSGFAASERAWIVQRLAALGARLRSFADERVELEISVKDREGTGQHVTLECWITRSHRLHLVATSSQADLSGALTEVRDELTRQVDDAKTRTEARGNRTLRRS